MAAARKQPDGECLLLRADASAATASGHIMRCVSLAQAWQSVGGRAHFVSAELPDSLQTRLRDAGCAVSLIDATIGSEQDAEQTLHIARRHDANIIVVDGYRFTADFQQRLTSEGRRLLVIDDGATADEIHADWILNQNFSAEMAGYRDRATQSQLLLGPRYALLGEQFTANHSAPRSTPRQARRILVTLGGSDPPNATRCVLEALSLPKMGGLETTVIVGGGNPHRESLEAIVEHSPTPIRIVTDTRKMAEHMARADLAVAGGGSTLLELASQGVPALLVLLAENQQLPAKAAEHHGIARILGWHDRLDPSAIAHEIEALSGDADARERMTRRGRETVDGAGAARVVRALLRPKVHLRDATLDDCHRWWEWRNEPEMRRVSFNSDAIPLASHEAWFRAALDDPLRRLLIVENAEREAIGFTRLDIRDRAVEVSLGVGPKHRGGGYGEPIIRLATCAAFEIAGDRPIEAFVKDDNIASRRVFEHADFEVVEHLAIQGKRSLRLRYRFAAGPTARAGVDDAAEANVTSRGFAA